jgi:hypothetical protein
MLPRACQSADHPIMKTIAFDETGNSGGDLTNSEQPVFCLGSVNLDSEQLSEVTEALRLVKAPEWKFAKIKKTPAQLRALTELLERSWVTSDVVKVYPIHKRFMVVTKFVDLLHEPLARENGLDLYQRGGALALANLLVTTLPVFLGETRFARFLQCFVDCVRTGGDREVRLFESELEKIRDFLMKKHPGPVADSFAPAILGCRRKDLWIDHRDPDELDPLVPAYFVLVLKWSDSLSGSFTVLADESKAVARQREHLMRLADPSIKPQLIPITGGEYASYPLKVTEIVTTCSQRSKQVQFADLVCGAANHVLIAIASRKPLDDIQQRLRNVFFGKPLFVGAMWPSSEVTPEGVEADHVVGETAVGFAVRVLGAHRPSP